MNIYIYIYIHKASFWLVLVCLVRLCVFFDTMSANNKRTLDEHFGLEAPAASGAAASSGAGISDGKRACHMAFTNPPTPMPFQPQPKPPASFRTCYKCQVPKDLKDGYSTGKKKAPPKRTLQEMMSLKRMGCSSASLVIT